MPGLPKLKTHQVLAFAILALALEGCATTHDSLVRSTLRSPVKIVVMESPMDIDPERLEKVLVPDSKHDAPNLKDLIMEGRAHAEEYAMTSMEASLASERGFEIVKPSPKAELAFANIQKAGLTTPLTQEQADLLHDDLGADAILRFGVTDYGLTPRAWHDGYITFEVVSTLAIAGIIASSASTVSKAAAGTYLAEETVEEATEAYAGFWALDTDSRPVRIEEQLIQLKPLSAVWSDSDTGLAHSKLSRLYRKVPDAEKHQQLDQATDEATKTLAESLSAALTRSSI